MKCPCLSCLLWPIKSCTQLLVFIVGAKATAFDEVHFFEELSRTICPEVISFLTVKSLFLTSAL